MRASSSRRSFLLTTSAGLAGAATWPLTGPLLASDEGPRTNAEPPAGAVEAAWPTQPPDLAREMVGVSHNNPARVRELLAERPSLARAAWDWGFGDWETALGAASHVGNREIAELLLANGARPTIFSAAMLGQLAVVRAFVVASPGIQATTGPHGLTLLHHARAGGAAARPVLDYLEAVGGADPRPESVPVAESEKQAILGSYRFGGGESEQIEIVEKRLGLTFERRGTTGRGLTHLGGLEFFPAGVPAVRIRFETADDRVVALVVRDGSRSLRAERVTAPAEA